MTSIEQLVGEFVDAWNAGRRPDVATFLERAGPGDRDELAAQLTTWLEIAPTPAYDAATKAAIAADPALAAALDAAAQLRAPLAQRLPPLRDRAGLGVRDVADRLTQRLGLADRQRATDYLERLERDELDERRLSRRLLDALAAILGADRDQLAPSPAGAYAFFRAEQDAGAWVTDDIDALSRAALSPAPGAPLDELDRLFLGGPEG